MKNILLFSFVCFGTFPHLKAQTVVYNDQLLMQLTKNQAVRLASNSAYLTSYEKQEKIYDEINQKLTQIVAIQNFIYDRLTNVNAALRQGKQIYFLSRTFVQIGINANEVLSLTMKHPEYAVLLNRYYIGATQELLKMQSELSNDILHEQNDFLMDPYDRQKLIQNLAIKAQMVNGYLICIKIRLKNAKKTPYIYQIPTINTYVNLDRMIVKGIVEKYKFILAAN